MGSSRAARRAGKNPNATPIALLVVSATASAAGSSRMGHSDIAPTTNTTAPAKTTPSKTAQKCEQHRLDQKLHQYVALPRPHGHANPDLPCSLGDRDEHDVHDSDPADEERHGPDRKKEHGQGAVDGVLRGAELGLRADDEIRLATLGDVVPLLQNRFRLGLGVFVRFGAGGGEHDAVHATARHEDEVRTRALRWASSPRRPGRCRKAILPS